MLRRRRFHMKLSPVMTMADGHRVTFVGVTFHSKSVMIEYDVAPPIDRRSNPFGSLLVGLVVTDDVDPEPYPTCWEDFDWSVHAPGRMTTRLDRRPPPDATRLTVSVRALRRVEEAHAFARIVPSDNELVVFAIDLPLDHAAPPDPTAPSET